MDVPTRLARSAATLLPLTVAVFACSDDSVGGRDPNVIRGNHVAYNRLLPGAPGGDAPVDRSELSGARRVYVFRDGRQVDSVTEPEARDRGLTVVDLGDDWAPYIFSEDASLGAVGRQPYRPTFVALANERFGDGPEWDRARADRFLELYGIFPTLNVLRRRLLDDERHACHAAIDDAALVDLRYTLRPGADLEGQRTRVRIMPTLGRTLERVRSERGLASIDALANDRRYGYVLRRYRAMRAPVQATRAMQGHLRCEGLLSRRAEQDVFDLWTAAGLKAYQRKHMIVSWGLLDDDTRQAMLSDSRELDYRAVLRALRERVVDATGVIEDGSTSDSWGTVVDRHLDAEDFHHVARYGALANGAPDLVSAATDRAARELGWTSPEATREWFRIRTPEEVSSLEVGVALPPKPSYYHFPMELRAEIDRGDVWFDYPYTRTGAPRGHPERKRPTITIFAKDGDREVALVRWDTTIGSWQPDQLPNGYVRLRYKESPAGTRVWRDIVASPAWLPPDSTPDEDLVRRRPGGDVINSDLVGPGYASAYGLAMAVNHLHYTPRGRTEPVFFDQGIRVHGSVSYQSILRSHSHGCHRLFNHLAVRLMSFLVKHRTVVRRGAMDVRYQRDVVSEGRALRLRMSTRGYLYELTPPVTVRVLEGQIRGRLHRAPAGGMLLREHLIQRALSEDG